MRLYCGSGLEMPFCGKSVSGARGRQLSKLPQRKAFRVDCLSTYFEVLYITLIGMVTL